MTAEERRVLPRREISGALYENGDRLPAIAGYVAVWHNGYYHHAQREQLERGAFEQALRQGGDVVALIDHGGQVLGSTATGTLKLEEDDIGLSFALTPRGQAGANLVAAIRRGEFAGMSWDGLTRRSSMRREYGVQTEVIAETTLREITFAGAQRPANANTFCLVLGDLRHDGHAWIHQGKTVRACQARQAIYDLALRSTT